MLDTPTRNCISHLIMHVDLVNLHHSFSDPLRPRPHMLPDVLPHYLMLALQDILPPALACNSLQSDPIPPGTCANPTHSTWWWIQCITRLPHVTCVSQMSLAKRRVLHVENHSLTCLKLGQHYEVWGLGLPLMPLSRCLKLTPPFPALLLKSPLPLPCIPAHGLAPG